VGCGYRINVTFGHVYIYAATGVMFRFGTNLNSDLAPPNIPPGSPGLSFFRASQQNSGYFFAGIEGWAVARNIFLDGNTFRNSQRVDKKCWVGILSVRGCFSNWPYTFFYK